MLNVFDEMMIVELIDVFMMFGWCDDVCVIVLCLDGCVFCVGVDL